MLIVCFSILFTYVISCVFLSLRTKAEIVAKGRGVYMVTESSDIV